MFMSRVVSCLFSVAPSYSTRFMYHIPVILSRAPSKYSDWYVLWCNISVRVVNMALYLLSQDYDMDGSALFVMSGNE